MAEALVRERAYFEAHKAEWAEDGLIDKFALICGSNVIGFFDKAEDAEHCALFGNVEGQSCNGRPYLVKQIDIYAPGELPAKIALYLVAGITLGAAVAQPSFGILWFPPPSVLFVALMAAFLLFVFA